jgi:preprotein translocase subunit SecF
MFIIKYKRIFIGISIALTVISISLLSIFGLKFGIDFKGGASMDINYQAGRPEQTLVQDSIKSLNIGEALVQPVGETGYSVKTKDLTENEHQSVLSALSIGGKFKVEEKSFNSIGPSVGKELAQKSILAIIFVSIAIILFISYAFRKVSRPVASWKYGLIAIVTLLHDIAIPTGLFTLLSHYRGVEVDTLFVVALLTVLGLSVSDTIVVFDRIRENLRYHSDPDFENVVGRSLSQTFTRSINTSMTIIIVLLALYFFGPVSTKTFALVLTVGLFFGTYSSIFLASPLLTVVANWQNRKSLDKKNK